MTNTYNDPSPADTLLVGLGRWASFLVCQSVSSLIPEPEGERTALLHHISGRGARPSPPRNRIASRRPDSYSSAETSRNPNRYSPSQSRPLSAVIRSDRRPFCVSPIPSRIPSPHALISDFPLSLLIAAATPGGASPAVSSRPYSIDAVRNFGHWFGF